MFHRTAKTPSQRAQQRGLFTRLRGRATAAAFGMAARRRSARGMATLLGAGLEYLPPYGPATRPLLWMLGKEGLNEDVLATFDDQPWARPADLPRGFVKSLADCILPPGIDDNTYATQDPAHERAKAQYRAAWRSVLARLPAHVHPAAVTTGNFGYYAEREFAGACQEEGIPFIAMHKECFKAPGRIDFFSKVYARRGAFAGRRILVYNQLERDVQVAAGVAARDRITVCGMPRMDRIHAWRVQQAGATHTARPPTLLAFGFTPKSGLPRIPRKSRGGVTGGFEHIDPAHERMAWTALFANYHEMLVRVARDNPQFRVVLKLKGRERDAAPSITAIQQLGQPDNLAVEAGGDPFDLLTQADAVCGFNTTALLEGVAAGLPVFVPVFDEASAPATAPFVPDLGAAAVACSDAAQMGAQIAAALSAAQRHAHARMLPAQLDDARNAMLEYWVGNTDGRAGQRVRAAFVAEMAQP